MRSPSWSALPSALAASPDVATSARARTIASAGVDGGVAGARAGAAADGEAGRMLLESDEDEDEAAERRERREFCVGKERRSAMSEGIARKG